MFIKVSNLKNKNKIHLSNCYVSYKSECSALNNYDNNPSKNTNFE